MGEHAPLGEFEQLVLLGVLHCSDEAYGVPVWKELEARARRDVSIGAVYKTLDRLEAKGFVASSIGEPTAERGGRGKRLYRVTAGGLRELRRSLATLSRMTDGLREVLETP